MARKSKAIPISKQQKQELLIWSRSQKFDYRYVLRSKIILYSLEGKAIKQIAWETGSIINKKLGLIYGGLLDYGNAPLWGEIEYQYRMSKRGWNDRKRKIINNEMKIPGKIHFTSPPEFPGR